MPKVADKSDHGRALGRLGDAIRRRRQSLGLSQEALADAAAINRTHMGEVERGKRNISVMALVKLAQAMGATAFELLSDAGL